MCVSVVFTVRRSFYPTTLAHPVSVLIPQPTIQRDTNMWPQVYETRQKTKIITTLFEGKNKPFECQRNGHDNTAKQAKLHENKKEKKNKKQETRNDSNPVGTRAQIVSTAQINQLFATGTQVNGQNRAIIISQVETVNLAKDPATINTIIIVHAIRQSLCRMSVNVDHS